MGILMLSRQAADNYRLARSQALVTPGNYTYDCVKIPKFAFIKNAWLWVKTAGSSDNSQVGFVGNGAAADDDFFLNKADAAVTATGYKSARTYVGAGDWRPFNGIWCSTAGGMVYLKNDTAAQTSGVFFVFVEYVILH